MKGLDRFLHYIDLTNEKIGRAVAYILVPLAIITITEVVARYVFDRPTLWAWDTNLQVFGIVIILGAGYTLLQGRHIKVEAILLLLPLRGRLVLELLGTLLVMWVAAVLIQQGGEWGWEAFVARDRLNTIWEPYVFHIKMLLPVGGVLLLFQGLAKFIRDLQTLWRGEEIEHVH